MASVDVIVPCYRYGHYLRDCVQSVLDQQGVGVRVLIIDDASPDDTPAVAAALVEQDGRVEYRRHATNQGHIATYNEGLAWAKADYLLLLSADDMLIPGALLRAALLMDAHPEVALTHGRAIWTRDGHADGVVSAAQNGSHILEGHEFLEICCSTGANPVMTPTAVVRTQMQKRIGGYRVDLPHSADMEMWMRFAVHASVGVVDACQAFYRWHGENMQTQYLVSPVRDVFQRWESFVALFDDYRDRIVDADRLRSLAARSLADLACCLAHTSFEGGQVVISRECLDFAMEICPALRSSADFYRMRCKHFLGPVVWRCVRPFYRGLRDAVRMMQRRKNIPSQVPGDGESPARAH